MKKEDLEKEFGIDILRRAVNFFNYCNESFNQRYSAEDLLKIAKACWLGEWDVFADQLTKQQIEAAIREGKSPKFEENYYGLHALEVSDCSCQPCRQKRDQEEQERDEAEAGA